MPRRPEWPPKRPGRRSGLEGDLFSDLGIDRLIDPAHTAVADLLDDLVAFGKYRAHGQFLSRHWPRVSAALAQDNSLTLL